MFAYFAAASIIALVVLGWAAVAWVLMLAWNASVPIIFGLPAIEFWQSLGLCILASLLGWIFRK